jgi:hypothetical protein
LLHEFLTSQHAELVRRCRSKVSQRHSPRATSPELEHGVPLFLGQLVEALRCEELDVTQGFGAAAESSRTAALHGKESLNKGYTVDQVVHGYGDICQAVTEMAKEENAPITIGEFHTLNRLLDNAIADAVASYALHKEGDDGAGSEAHDGDARDLHQRVGTLADEQSLLLETALSALDALKVGNIGLMGATGILLEDSLLKLRDLIHGSLPETRRPAVRPDA